MTDYRNRAPVDETDNPWIAMRGLWRDALASVTLFVFGVGCLYACAVAFGLASRPGWL